MNEESKHDDKEPASVPTLLVFPGQSVADAKRAAGLSNDVEVVIVMVRDSRRAA